MDMLWTILLVASVTIFPWLLRKWWDRRELQTAGVPGLKSKRLLTDNEVEFYHRLSRAVAGDWLIFPQVSMGALVDTTLSPENPNYWPARSEFSSKICDFVLCHPKTLTPVLVVELDDVMHDFSKDAKRDELMARAGHRTLRFWSRKKPSIGDLKLEIDRALALVPR